MKTESIINILSNAKRIICIENIDNCRECQLGNEIITENQGITNVCKLLDDILKELESVE
jgi:hypothetical protein